MASWNYDFPDDDEREGSSAVVWLVICLLIMGGCITGMVVGALLW